MPKDPTNTLPDPPRFDPTRSLRPRPPPPNTTRPRGGGSRTNKLLGFDFIAPSYKPWNAKGVGNSYSPFWTGVRNISATDRGVFEFSLKEGEDKNLKYATEHVYEIQIIPLFFDYMDKQIKAYFQNAPGLPKSVQDFGERYNNDPLFWKKLLTGGKASEWTNFPKWKPVVPINAFSSCLAGGFPSQNADFMYLEDGVNGMKGILMRGGVPEVLQAKPSNGNEDVPAVKLLNKIANAKLVGDYLAEPTVAKVYNNTSARVLQAVEDLQQALIQAGTNTFLIQIGSFDWPGHYKAFEKAYLDNIGRVMLNLKKEAFEEAIKGLELSLKSNYQRGKGPTSKIGAAITALLEKIRSPAEQDRLVPNALFALAALRQNHNVNMEGDLPAGYKSVKNPIPVPQNTAAVVAEVEAAEYEDDEEEDEVDEENAEATAPAIATPPPGPAGVGAPAPRSGQSLPLRPATGRPREPEEEKEEEGPGEEEEKAGAPATATPTLPPAEAGTRTKGSSGSLPIRAATAVVQTVGPTVAKNLAPAAVSTFGPPIAKAGAKAVANNLFTPSGSK